MREALTDASEELKRVDHLIYVSLKYTRSVDVLRNVLQRIINAIESLQNALLIDAEEEGKITGIPNLPVERCQRLKEISGEFPLIVEMTDFYLFLRKAMRVEFGKSQEFRRHVTMSIVLEGDKPIDIDIDKVHEYYEKLKEYFDFTFEALKAHEEKKEAKKSKKK